MRALLTTPRAGNFRSQTDGNADDDDNDNDNDNDDAGSGASG